MPTDPEAPIGDRRTRLHRAVRRGVLARRRPLAALCAGVAVLAGVHAARPPAPRTVVVTVAARDLPSGTVLGRGDLTVRRFPAAVAPVGSDVHAVGRTIAAPVRRGEPVTDVRLVAPSLVAAYPGRVVLPVRIADPDVVALLHVGDTVDLIAADPRRGTASYVATEAPVLALPTAPEGEIGTATLGGRLVVVAALPSEVDRIVGASATDLLSVVISG